MHGIRPSATIEALLVSTEPASFYTTVHSELEFDVEQNGIIGDTRHRGTITYADVRTSSYVRGQDTVLNRQSVSIVGGGDMDYVADALELDAEAIIAKEAEISQLDRGTVMTLLATSLHVAQHTLESDPSRITRLFLAQCLGANILLGDYCGNTEMPEFRHLLRGTDVGPFDQERHKFTDATVMITRPNAPCRFIVPEVAKRYPSPIADLGRKLLNSSRGRRGYVGMVAKGGRMTVGQSVHFVPLGE